MEALSAVASVIALTQAAEKLLKVAKVAKSVGEIPNEYHSLLQELEFVKALASNVDTHIQSHEATDVGLLRSVSQRLDRTALDLEQMSEAVERSSRLSNAKTTRDHIKVSTIRWQLNKSDIAKTKNSISQAKEDLTLCLQLLVSRQTTSFSQALEEVRQILLAAKEGIPQPSTPELADSSSMNTPSRDPATPQDLLDIEPYPKRSDYGFFPDPDENSPYCGVSCPCKCHDMPATKPFLLVEYFLGDLIINKNFKLFSKEPCDVPTCKWPSPLLVNVRYTSPSWTVRRAFEASLSWGAMHGAGVNLHLRVPRVISPLPFWLIYTRDVVGLRRELSSGKVMPADVTYYGRSLLEFAIRDGGDDTYTHADIVRLLLDFGCDPAIGSTKHSSAITRARGLLREGSFTSYPGYAATLQRIGYKNGMAKNVPVRMNGILRAFFIGDNERLKTVLDHCKEDLNYLDECGRGAIHYAILQNRTDALESLLQKGAHTELRNGDGVPPLMLAVGEDACLQLLELLLQYGAKTDSIIRSETGAEDLGTPIMLTLRQPAKMRLLLDYGASACIQGAEWETPLHYFRVWGILSYSEYDSDSTEVSIEDSIRLLEAEGIGIDYQDSAGLTPLMCAAERLDTPTMLVLLRLGARIDKKAVDGRTILHIAAGTRDRDVFDALRTVDLSAVEDMRDEQGTHAREYAEPWIPYRGRMLTEEEFETFFDELWRIRVAKVLPGPNCFS